LEFFVVFGEECRMGKRTENETDWVTVVIASVPGGG